MKFKATALAMALAGAAVAGSAQASLLSESASAFSYDHVGVSYVESEVNGYNIKQDGFAFDGSLSVTPNFYVSGELSLTEEDSGAYEDTGVRLGAGYHRDLGLSIPTDVVAELGVTATTTDVSGGSEDRHFAWDAKLGVRTNLGVQGLDATAYLGMAEKDDTSGGYEFGMKYGVEANYFVTSEVSVGVDYAVQADFWADEEDLETISFGAKYHF